MSRYVAFPALVICLAAAVLFAPSLLRGRDLVASTPSPRPLFDVTPVELPPATPLCLTEVTIPDDARQVRFQVITRGKPGPPLTVTLTAGAYTQRLAVPAGYADETTVAARVDPPPANSFGEVCITNDGASPVALTGTTETRTRSRPVGMLAARPVDADTYLAFYVGATGSPLAHLGDMVDRMGAFRPGIVGPWLLWPLLLLVVAGIPAGVLWAVRAAAR
jgi:hypothetical protein